MCGNLFFPQATTAHVHTLTADHASCPRWAKPPTRPSQRNSDGAKNAARVHRPLRVVPKSKVKPRSRRGRRERRNRGKRRRNKREDGRRGMPMRAKLNNPSHALGSQRTRARTCKSRSTPEERRSRRTQKRGKRNRPDHSRRESTSKTPQHRVC